LWRLRIGRFAEIAFVMLYRPFPAIYTLLLFHWSSREHSARRMEKTGSRFKIQADVGASTA